jgi:hypothetical protein
VNTSRSVVVDEGIGEEVTPIGTEGAQLLLGGAVGLLSDMLAGVLHAILGGQQLNPHEPAVVIDEQKEHLLPTRSGRRDGAAIEAGVVVVVVVAGGHTPTPMKKVRAEPNQVMSVGPVASLVIGPWSAGPKGERKPKPMSPRKKRPGCY